MLTDPVAEAFLEFVRAHPDLARASFSQLKRTVTSEPVTYHRSQAFFLCPFILGADRWREAQDATARLVRLAAGYVTGQLAGRPLGEVAADLGVAPTALALAGPWRTAASAAALARPDFVLTSRGPVFLELNIDSSLGGLGTADDLSLHYLGSPLMGAFSARHRFVTDPVVPRLASQLGGLRRQPGGELEGAVAIVDWDEEIAENPWPYERLQTRLQEAGMRVVIAGQSALAYDGCRLHVNGHAVEVVYRGITPDARLERGFREFDALWEAVRRGHVVMLSDLWAPLFSSKVVLARLSEAADLGGLAPGDCEFIQRHVPWTRVLGEGRARRHGSIIDLVPFVIEHRPELVIKSPNEGSARNVTVGQEVDQVQWEACVQRALTAGRYVVQQFIPLPTVMQPVLVESGFELVPFQVVHAAFVFDGRAGGSCVRGVGAGAGLRISCSLGAHEGVVFLSGGQA